MCIRDRLISGIILGALWDSVEDGKVNLVHIGLSVSPGEPDKMKMPQFQVQMLLTQLFWGVTGNILG